MAEEATKHQIKTDPQDPSNVHRVQTMSQDVIKHLSDFQREHQQLARMPKKKRTKYMQYGASNEYVKHLGQFANNLNQGMPFDDKEFRQKCVKKRKRLRMAGSRKVHEANRFLKSPKGAGVCHMLASQATKWIQENININPSKSCKN